MRRKKNGFVQVLCKYIISLILRYPKLSLEDCSLAQHWSAWSLSHLIFCQVSFIPWPTLLLVQKASSTDNARLSNDLKHTIIQQGETPKKNL
jgi:hypothetical protein